MGAMKQQSLLRPPEKLVSPATPIAPADCPGVKPRLVSATSGLMAVPPEGSAAKMWL